MPFGDILTSSRGPGFIGIVIALLVLGGFGVLFLLSFDDSGSERSLAAQIRDNDDTIQYLRSEIATKQEKVERTLALQKISEEISEKEVSTVEATNNIAQISDQIDDISSAYSKLEETFHDYKNQYRAQVREAAIGKTYEVLNTLDGKKYLNAEVRNISPIGFEIRHRDGIKRIPFENLPEEMQDYFQFDANQKESELKREEEMRERHIRALRLAKIREETAKEARQQAEAEKTSEKNAQMIKKLEERLVALRERNGLLLKEIHSPSSNIVKSESRPKDLLKANEAQIERIYKQINKLRGEP